MTCALAVMSATAIVLAGWWLELPLVSAIQPGRPLPPASALALFFAAAGVLFLHRPAVVRVLALVPALLGLLALAAYVLDVRDGGAAIFLRSISVRASAGMLLAGLALLWPRPAVVAGAFAATTAFIGAVSTVAYFAGATFLPGAAVAPMSLSAALLLIVWAVAYAAATIQEGPLATFLMRGRWGRGSRALALVAIAVPVTFGHLCIYAAGRHIFDLPFAVAMLATASSLTLVAVSAFYTYRLRQYDEARAAADTLYRTIVETSQEGIFVTDAQFRLQFVNRRGAEMLGYAPEELIGDDVRKLVLEADRPAAADRLATHAGGVTSTRAEVRLVHRDGTIRHVISGATPLGATPATPGLVLTTVADISDRVQAEEALRASEARFRGLYASNLIGVAFWSYDGTVTDANDAFLRLFGVGQEELPGWRWSSRQPDGSDADAIDETAMSRLRQSGRCAPFEKEFLRPDGSRFSALVALAAADDGTNIVFVIDVTERVEARRKLERAHAILSARLSVLEGHERLHDELETLAARLTESHEELETFSYSVSHDLRAPLRAIDGFARELQLGYEPVLDAGGRDYVRRIRRAARRMSLLIDDLLTLARVGNTVVARRHVDVSALARDVASEMRERCSATVQIDVENGLRAAADPHLLRVLLENVIGNAVKFSSQRDTPQVAVFRADDGSIGVRDNGVGFDSRHAQKIFAPFQRLHAAEFEGTGIGLALVHRIVRRHGGAIRVESSPGSGATFFFNFPPAEEAA